MPITIDAGVFMFQTFSTHTKLRIQSCNDVAMWLIIILCNSSIIQISSFDHQKNIWANPIQENVFKSDSLWKKYTVFESFCPVQTFLFRMFRCNSFVLASGAFLWGPVRGWPVLPLIFSIFFSFSSPFSWLPHLFFTGVRMFLSLTILIYPKYKSIPGILLSDESLDTTSITSAWFM